MIAKVILLRMDAPVLIRYAKPGIWANISNPFQRIVNMDNTSVRAALVIWRESVAV
jgi:hypothetical protein